MTTISNRRRDVSRHVSWVSALLAVAATYFFFLIFAEFAFLTHVATHLRETSQLRWIMLGLGAGGMSGAILAARVSDGNRGTALKLGFIGCAIAAGGSLVASSLPQFLAAGFAIGLSLGWLTVTLAASLRVATGGTRLGLCIGGGTGLAYAGCNIPAVFHAPPHVQALLAVAAVAAAALLPLRLEPGAANRPDLAEYDPASLARWVAILLALVWMDSAAFYIVQHTGPLQAATWREPAALWGNAAVHLMVAVGAGLLLDRGRRGALAISALVALALACLVLGGKLPAAFRPGWFYSAGVSAYSALLVEYPARNGRASVAALVFGVAGWVGSALGIGMAQDLNYIPTSFVLGASALLFAALGWRVRVLRRAVAGAALCAIVSVPSLPAAEDELIARGREVYIAEGCIHCHSQFVRTRAPVDIAWWGPATVVADSLAKNPPLFGTRRQGPDLANVGNRRTAEWNRLHLIAPQEISPGSRMPSYAYLFAGGKGDGAALVAYLGSLGRASMPARLAQINAWTPRTDDVISANQSRRLFQQLCAHCHGPAGRGDGRLAPRLSLPPPDWTTSPWRRVSAEADVDIALSRIIKFGAPGTPMAGHEYLPDAEIVGLARFVRGLHSAVGGGAAVASRR